MKFPFSPYLYLGGALAVLLALAGAYAYGRSDGAQIEQAAQARAARAVLAERDRRATEVAVVDAAGANAEIDRQTTVRETRHDVERIIERPVYRSVCTDADSVPVLDRATAAANGDDPRAPAGAAAPDSARPPAS